MGMEYHRRTIAHNVAELLRLRSMDETELGTAIGKPPENVSQLLRGEVSPSLETLTAVASHLGVSVFALLNDAAGATAVACLIDGLPPEARRDVVRYAKFRLLESMMKPN